MRVLDPHPYANANKTAAAPQGRRSRDSLAQRLGSANLETRGSEAAMTAEREVQAGFDTLVRACAQGVAERGYALRRNRIVKVAGGNAAVLEFQRSQGNTKEDLRFTVNVGVVCGALLADWQPLLARCGAADAHLGVRLGFLLPERSDRWWRITPQTDLGALIAELAAGIATVAAPYAERYLATEDLAALWRSGPCPGLTEFQKEKYLAELAQAASPTAGIGRGT